MATRPHVPQFGNWEGEDDVPYTVYFDKARKGRNDGKMINPNDPQENPDLFNPPPAQPRASRTGTRLEESVGRGPVRPIQQERPASRENGNNRRFNESAPQHNDNMGRKGTGESTHQQNGGHGSGSGLPVRSSPVHDRSFDKSPIHPQHRAKMMGKDGGSPAREGKNSYDSSQGTHGKSRMKPATRNYESVDRGATVPRFGEWDQKDPQSAEEYTGIFDNARKERRNGSTPPPLSPAHNYRQTNIANDNHKPCCFPWWKK